MSFFGELKGGGIRPPDVQINQDGGNLLPTASGVRFSGAQINKTNNLLSNIDAYSYGQQSVSDDMAYGVNPHRISKVIPSFKLPGASTSPMDDFTLSHGVSKNDLCFTIRMTSGLESRIKGYSWFVKQGISRAVDPIINLATLNYIIRGLQTNNGANDVNWENFLQSTGWPMDQPGYGRETFYGGKFQHRNVSMFIQDYIRPLGVVIGRFAIFSSPKFQKLDHPKPEPLRPHSSTILLHDKFSHLHVLETNMINN